MEDWIDIVLQVHEIGRIELWLIRYSIRKYLPLLILQAIMFRFILAPF